MHYPAHSHHRGNYGRQLIGKFLMVIFNIIYYGGTIGRDIIFTAPGNKLFVPVGNQIGAK